jgi:hypothetical protein
MYQDCFLHTLFMPLSFGFGMVFHCLNAFYQDRQEDFVVRLWKVFEGVQANNDLDKKKKSKTDT